ncbi:WecB/TagA/CpsF family glycosyltransferase [Bosea sp. ASV33]|uniref:WecB/TagA/CpsF family glycosyltransferase n=1 Tax=Bosea sp. ASV33 TaxID=2795106 RepID=UPI0018ECE1D0
MRAGIIQDRAGIRAVPEREGEAGEIAALLRDCAGRGRTVFFFGGDSRTIYALRDRVASALPALKIAGICDADFSEPIDRAVLDHIAAANADVIVSDLPETRFRLFRAQCSAAGIYGKRFNQPGSFQDFAFGPRRGFSSLLRVGRWLGFGSAALTFLRIILTQRLRGVVPQARGPVSPRRGGRG